MGSLSLIERGFALALPLAVAGAGAALIKMGMDAQTQLSIVAGLTGSTAKQMEYYTTSLESMGARFGMTLDESAKGLYYVVSAGYKGADAINVLTASMLHAAATGTPLKDVANGLTSAMNAYGASASEATRYSDILTTAITYGKQTTADFANNVSKAALMASAAHVPFTQLAAAESALTEKGEPANRAFTELSFLMSKIAISAETTGKSVRALGGHFDETKYASLDLMGKLLYLRNATGLTTDEFLKVIGGTRSARGALGLLADGGVAYNKILDAMRNNTKVTEDAFNIHTHNMAFAFERVKAAASNAGFELVKMISPGVVDFVGRLSDKLDHLPDLFRAIGNAVGPAFASLGGTVTKVDGPMVTFGKHLRDAQTILNTHKGLLSQVGDAIKPLFDSYTTLVRHTANFRGDIVATSTELHRLKGTLSQLGDVMHAIATTVLPILGAAFAKLPDLIRSVGNLIGWIREDFDVIGPILVGVASIIASVLVSAFVAWATAAGAAAIATLAATWPIIAALAVLGLLVTGLVLAYTHWGWFKIAVDAARDAMGWAKDRIGDLMGQIGQLAHWIGDNLLPKLGWAKDRFNDWGPSISGAFDALGRLKDGIIYISGPIGNLLGVVGHARDVFGNFLDKLGAIKEFIWGSLGDAIGHLIDLINSIHMPDILGGLHLPGMASGGVSPGGASSVGENGPELAIFPTGTRIIPAAQTAALLGGGGGSSGGGGGSAIPNVPININIGGTRVAQILLPELVAEIRRATGIRI